MYGFLTECRHRYNLEVYQKFNDLFAWLPLAGAMFRTFLTVDRKFVSLFVDNSSAIPIM